MAISQVKRSKIIAFHIAGWDRTDCYHHRYTKRVVRQAAGVMVWGGIWSGGQTDLYILPKDRTMRNQEYRECLRSQSNWECLGQYEEEAEGHGRQHKTKDDQGRQEIVERDQQGWAEEPRPVHAQTNPGSPWEGRGILQVLVSNNISYL